MSRLITLYPAAWRQRYEDEFLELLETRPPGIRARFDILLGAIDAHLRAGGAPGLVPEPRWKAVVLGFVVFLGAIVIAVLGPVQRDELGSYVDGGAALVPFAIALMLLVAGLVPVIDRLPVGNVRGRRAGWVALATGPVWGLAPWIFLLAVVFFVSLTILAIEARREAIWPRWSGLVIGGLLTMPSGLAVATAFLPWYAMRLAGPGVLLLLPIGALWPVLALLLRRGLPPLKPA
jgi:hypothetical protein